LTDSLRQGGPVTLRSRPVLVTGGAGFIGANLSDRLAADGHDVLVFDALVRPGVAANLDWLRRRHPRRISAVIADVRDEAAVTEAVGRASAVFHLAAQVAVTTSMAAPMDDFDVNVRGTLHVLEALRHRSERVPVVFASTNKVYGDLHDIALDDSGPAYLPQDAALRAHGIGEDRALAFYTPYGCSKGAADQYVLDYARSFGIPACVLRMSCIYGPRQMGTEDQGWLAHFLISVLDGRPISIYGDGRQVRDVLFVDDAVAAYLGAWQRIGGVSGRAFNLGGGAANAVTLLQVLAEMEAATGRRADISFSGWRPGDQRYFVADSRRAQEALGLGRFVGWRDGLGQLTSWMQAHRIPDARPVAAG
jgi:CDP-paratose 2-epimerase